MKKILICLTIFGLIIGSGKLVTKVVKAVETTLGATVTSGSLTIDNTTAVGATFDSIAVSTIEQVTNGVIGDTDAVNTVGIEVSDLRGTGVGWALTMTSTNLTTMGTAKTLAGTNNTVGFSGVYTGVDALTNTSGHYTVEITTGGSVGIALFTWTDPSGTATTGVATASSVVLSNGVTVTFDPATYVMGDKWSVTVDALRYGYDTNKGLTVNPRYPYAASGVDDGMSAGISTLLTGTGVQSDPITVLTAPIDTGMGDYFIDLGLSQTVHPNAYAGSYTAVATLTVS
jgi:hypothetical protein